MDMSCLRSGLGTAFGRHAQRISKNDLSHVEASREVFSEAQRWWEALDLLQVGHVSGPKWRGTPNMEHQILLHMSYVYCILYIHLTSFDRFDDQHSRWSTELTTFGSIQWKEGGLLPWSITGDCPRCLCFSIHWSAGCTMLYIVLTLPVFNGRRPIAVQMRMIAAIWAQ